MSANTNTTLTAIGSAGTSAAGVLGLTAAQLTFDDEFNGFTNSPDGSAGWQTQMPYYPSRTLPTGETEYYSDSSVGVDPFSVSNGVLTIRAAPSTPNASNNYQPNTSGLIQSRNLATQTYGYFEAGINVTTLSGFWPAFWLTSVDNTYGGELDAAEILSGDPTKIYNTTHVLTRAGTKVATLTQVSLPTSLSAGFHAIGIDWEPDYITWYIDGVASSRQPTASYGLNKPMYMILCQAVGGWAGAAPLSYSSADMQIDYVRTYATANTVDVAGSGVIKTGGVVGTVKDATGNPLAGTTVTLLDASGHVIATTSSGVTGSFSFNGLAAGTYKLLYSGPPGFVPQVGSTANATGGLGASFTVANSTITTVPTEVMATASLGSITGTVTFQPNSWTAASAEAGATVILLDKGGFTQLATTVTDANGRYTFTNLAAGQYYVQIAPPAYEAYISGPITPLTQKSGAIKVTAGATTAVATEVMGPANGAFSGIIRFDPDAGGVQAAAPQAGVTVSVLDDYGNVLNTAVTNSYGVYTLTSAPGWYTIKVTLPAGERVGSGVDPATLSVRGLAAAGRNTNQPDITLVTADSTPASITGSLTYQGAGQAGVLIGLINADHTQIATATTDANGVFSFTNLNSGSYQVQYSAAPGTTLLSGPASSSTGLTGVLRLAPGQAMTMAAETLVALPAAIKGTTVYAGQALAGITVYLRNAAGTTISTATTDANGAFVFANQRPGTYSVAYVVPSGVVPQSGPADNTTGITGALTLSGGQTLTLGAETFVTPPATASVSGSVVSSNVGVLGVQVTLLIPGSVATPASTRTTTTGATGAFSFTNLVPGFGYQLRYTMPSGATILSGADATTGLSSSFGLGASTNRALGPISTSIPIGSITGTLYLGTSALNAGTVSLLDGRGVTVATTTTNTWGSFTFNGVQAGTYSVRYGSLPGMTFKTGDLADATGTTAPLTVAAGQKITLAIEHLVVSQPVALTLNGSGTVLTKGDGAYSVTGTPNKGVLTLGNGPQTVTLGGNANTVKLGNGNQTVTLTGWNGIVTVGTGTSVINAGLGFATVRAAGNATISAGGSNNLFDAGPGANVMTVDPNGTRNSFVLNGYGQGLTTINGFAAARNDTLVLTRTLSGVSIASDLSNLGTYVRAVDGTAGTTLFVAPTGTGNGYGFALLSGVHGVTVASLVSNNNVSL